jgi:hypothetical protein
MTSERRVAVLPRSKAKMRTCKSQVRRLSRCSVRAPGQSSRTPPAPNDARDRLAESSLHDIAPWHEDELLAVVDQRETPTRRRQGASVDTGDPVARAEWAMPEPGLLAIADAALARSRRVSRSSRSCAKMNRLASRCARHSLASCSPRRSSAWRTTWPNPDLPGPTLPANQLPVGPGRPRRGHLPL